MEYGMAPEPKHIDRKLLYTNLEERIKYLHHFLDFNSGKPHSSINTVVKLSNTSQATSKH
jgi:hypothetical protein